MTPEQIVDELARNTPDRRPTMTRISNEGQPEDVAAALGVAATTPFVRMLLCDLLGQMRAATTIDALLTALSDTDSRVRAAAADAAGKVFGYVDEPLGPATRDRVRQTLEERIAVEDSDAVLSTLMQTAALLGDPSVRPLLESRLDHPDRRVRRQAAWGLDYLARKSSG